MKWRREEDQHDEKDEAKSLPPRDAAISGWMVLCMKIMITQVSSSLTLCTDRSPRHLLGVLK
jgi:hypothetical protein